MRLVLPLVIVGVGALVGFNKSSGDKPSERVLKTLGGAFAGALVAGLLVGLFSGGHGDPGDFRTR